MGRPLDLLNTRPIVSLATEKGKQDSSDMLNTERLQKWSSPE